MSKVPAVVRWRLAMADDESLSLVAKAVAHTLALSMGTHTLKVRVGIALLARRGSMSRSSVKRGLRELEMASWITCDERGHTKDGVQHVSVWTGTWGHTDLGSDGTQVPDGATWVHTGRDQGSERTPFSGSFSGGTLVPRCRFDGCDAVVCADHSCADGHEQAIAMIDLVGADRQAGAV